MANYLDSNERMWEDYKIWLVRHELKMPAETCKRLSNLIDFLHGKDFFPPTIKDEARGSDGLDMRVSYLDYSDLDNVMFHHNPKVLEVLVALSQRMEVEYVGDPGDPKPYIIFLDIIENNLKLKPNMSEIKVRTILADWLNGDRPLFKTDKKPNSNDIWSQMQMYIHENYS